MARPVQVRWSRFAANRHRPGPGHHNPRTALAVRTFVGRSVLNEILPDPCNRGGIEPALLHFQITATGLAWFDSGNSLSYNSFQISRNSELPGPGLLPPW